jgi:hypothetical protein
MRYLSLVQKWTYALDDGNAAGCLFPTVQYKLSLHWAVVLHDPSNKCSKQQCYLHRHRAQGNQNISSSQHRNITKHLQQQIGNTAENTQVPLLNSLAY